MVAGLGGRQDGGGSTSRTSSISSTSSSSTRQPSAGGIFLSQHRGGQITPTACAKPTASNSSSPSSSLSYISLSASSSPSLSCASSSLATGRRRPSRPRAPRYLRVLLVSSIPHSRLDGDGLGLPRHREDLGSPRLLDRRGPHQHLLQLGLHLRQTWALPASRSQARRSRRISRGSARWGAFLAWTAYKRPSFFFRPLRLFAIDGRPLREDAQEIGAPIFFSETAWVVSEDDHHGHLQFARRRRDRGPAWLPAGTIANLFMLIFGAIQSATGVIVGSTLGAGKTG